MTAWFMKLRIRLARLVLGNIIYAQNVTLIDGAYQAPAGRFFCLHNCHSYWPSLSKDSPATPTDPAPRYVFGPVERDVSLNFGDLYIWDDDYERVIHQAPAKTTLEANFRRAYRIGQSYQHDGGPCPLADGSVRVFAAGGRKLTTRVKMKLTTRVKAKNTDWPNVTSFTPLDEGSGK